MVVRETSNVTLTCRAAGYPEPYVMWRREDGEDINYNGETGKHFLSTRYRINGKQIIPEIRKKKKSKTLEDKMIARLFLFLILN